MGTKSRELRLRTERRFRATRLTEPEQAALKNLAWYEGSPAHKRNPQDFGLTPPAAPRPDATLCDDAGPINKAQARALLASAIDNGLVSEATTGQNTPKHLWVVHEGRVFEAAYGGSRTGAYHGYPVRLSDPLHAKVLEVWSAR